MGTRQRRTRYVPLYLPGDVYARLEQQALAAERDPMQHARWLIRQAVEADGRDRAPVAGDELVASGAT